MENGDIPDGSILASAANEYARYARLNDDKRWSVPASEVAPWIQADIQYQTYVSGVLTQGDGDLFDLFGDWIMSFKVSTFPVDVKSEQKFVPDENGNDMVIYGVLLSSGGATGG